MRLMDNTLRHLTQLAIAATAIAVTGCQQFAVSATASLSAKPDLLTKAEKEPEPTPEPAPKPRTAYGDSDDGLALFGDRPEMEPLPTEGHITSNLTRHTATEDGLDFDPDILDTEGLIAFASTRNAPRSDIYLKRADGHTLTQLTDDAADDVQPRFSADGKQIVFASNRTGNWDIWKINRDGTGLMQLTDDPTDEVAPCWSPDGSQIAYTVWNESSSQWEIWAITINQPGLRRFLVSGMFPSWAPDGGKLVFQRARQRDSQLFSIWTVELVDGEARFPTEVARQPSAACIAPRWSPDGTRLVYCIARRLIDEDPARPSTRATDIWTVDVASGVRTKMTDGGHSAHNPVWSNDGRIFFVSNRAGTENVWSLNTGQIRQAEAKPETPTNEPRTRTTTRLTSDV